MKTCEFQVKSHKLRTAHFLQDLVFKVKKKSRWKCPFSTKVILNYCCMMLDVYHYSWRSWKIQKKPRVSPKNNVKQQKKQNNTSKKLQHTPKKKHIESISFIQAVFFRPAIHRISWNPHLLVDLFPILLAQGEPCDGTSHCSLPIRPIRLKNAFQAQTSMNTLEYTKVFLGEDWCVYIV